ncbi:MAG: hypothetical protein PHP06_04755 [Clostridia bacterium]|nr:hypothetical protein [Clostridia bacterium]
MHKTCKILGFGLIVGLLGYGVYKVIRHKMCCQKEQSWIIERTKYGNIIYKEQY